MNTNVRLDTRIRPAAVADVGHLVEMMREFYAESGFRLDLDDRAAVAFEQLLGDERLGRVWIFEVGGNIAGYVVVTLGYSMEYGGFDAFVDDLYVRSEYRGKGLGKAALTEARTFCTASGVRALHLEVGPDNTVAQELYRKVGFQTTGRQLLTLRLASAL